MGYYSDGITIQPNFRPNDILTRAEAGTLLSRLLRGTTYASNEIHWYEKHLQALKDHNIMYYITTPMMQEIRGNMFIMLMGLSQL